MKLSKIKALCKSTKNLVIFNELTPDGELRAQWVSDGQGMYPLAGMLTVTPEQMKSILDLKDVNTRTENLPVEFCGRLDRTADMETLTEMLIVLRARGTALWPLQTEAGDIVLINEARIAPFFSSDTIFTLIRSETGNWAAGYNRFACAGIVPTYGPEQFTPMEAQALREIVDAL